MNKKLKKIVLLAIILFISIGFAVLTTNLSVVTNLSFRENTWDVHFENAEVMDSSTALNNTVTIDTNNKTSIYFETTLAKPSDYIDFSFYVVNKGTIDAQLNSITTTLTTAQQEYITYNITYDLDNSSVANNDYLYRGQSRKINVHFEYKYDVENFYSGEAISPTITFKYIQPQSSNTTVWNYEYSGTEQYFIVPKTGTYKLEVWGAQGGSASYYGITYDSEIYTGGYGGYSIGTINFTKNQQIYVNVGGAGKLSVNDLINGGYNGGGSASSPGDKVAGSGGGATHLALDSGELSTLSSHKSDNHILIVAGGGGGASVERNLFWANGGSGGGYTGVNGGFNIFPGNPIYNRYGGYGGTQSSGGSGMAASTSENGKFGLGGISQNGSGGGSGYYGGGYGLYGSSAGGGSGYIGNTNLSNKIMYCYNCQSSESEEDETNIKTRSTTNVSSTPTSNYAKMGNGFARITFIG